MPSTTERVTLWRWIVGKYSPKHPGPWNVHLDGLPGAPADQIEQVDYVPAPPRGALPVGPSEEAKQAAARAIEVLDGSTEEAVGLDEVIEVGLPAAYAIDSCSWEPRPGEPHPVGKAFYDLTVGQRDRAWREIEELKRELADSHSSREGLHLDRADVIGVLDGLRNGIDRPEQRERVADWIESRFLASEGEEGTDG